MAENDDTPGSGATSGENPSERPEVAPQPAAPAAESPAPSEPRSEAPQAPQPEAVDVAQPEASNMAQPEAVREPQPEASSEPQPEAQGSEQAAYQQQTAYDQVAHDQAAYDQAASDQAAYDQAAYAHAQYAQQYSQQQYAQAGYAQAGYDGQPGYGQQPQSYDAAAGGYAAQSGVYAQQPEAYAYPGTAFSAPAQPEAKRGHSTGTFLAGLAVAALIGGVVGGGTSALVSANTQTTPGPSVVHQNGTVTLNNPETATNITGVAAIATPSVVTITVTTATSGGSGSGVIYSADGYIITNAHVVTLNAAATSPRIRVQLSDGRVFNGTIVGTAPYADIAVVKIEADNLTPIKVADSGQVNVGDLAVAIGAPLSLSNTVTSGVVSALNRGISVGSALIPQNPSQEDEDDEGTNPWDFRFDSPDQNTQQQTTGGQVTLPVIQTDASINPGNSGGALLNGKGELIGINVAIMSPGASEGKASSAGLGFAIPSQLASRVADEIISGQKPSHGLLGASVVDSSLDTDEDADHTGGLIRELSRGGAAEKAGLRVGDVITAVNGIPAADGTSVSALIRMNAGGSEVRIDYTRGGKAGQVTATLGTLEW